MTGVAAMPPSAPRLVTVIVEPVSSSRAALPARAAAASRRSSAALCHRSSASAWRTTGTSSPPSVCVATPICTRRMAVQDAGLVVVAGVDLRVRRGGVDDRAHQERQQRQVLARRGRSR